MGRNREIIKTWGIWYWLLFYRPCRRKAKREERKIRNEQGHHDRQHRKGC